LLENPIKHVYTYTYPHKKKKKERRKKKTVSELQVEGPPGVHTHSPVAGQAERI
jgi:hypothetical protein